MPDYPDYYRLVDIVAQTLEAMKIDIIEQTIAALKIDVFQQTLDAVKIDLFRQTLAAINANISIIAQQVALHLVTQWQAKEILDWIIYYDSGTLAGGASDYAETVVPAGEEWYVTGFNYGNHQAGPYADGGYWITHYEAGVPILMQALAAKGFQQHTLPKPYRVPEANTIRTGVYNPTAASGRYAIIIICYKLPAASMEPSEPTDERMAELETARLVRGNIALNYYEEDKERRVSILNAVTQRLYVYEPTDWDRDKSSGKLILSKPVKLR